jgi:hypothetical protein
MQQSSAVATLDLLIRIHGRTIINISGVASEIGWSPGSIRNGISAGTFPIKSFLLGGRRMFYLADVAEYIDQQRYSETALASLQHPGKKGHRSSVTTVLA